MSKQWSATGWLGLLVVVGFVAVIGASLVEQWENGRSSGDSYSPPRRQERQFFATPQAEHPWWCHLDRCYERVFDCDNARRADFTNGDDPPACEGRSRVACFTRRNVLESRNVDRRCFSSITLCNNTRDNVMRGVEADWTIDRDCAAE